MMKRVKRGGVLQGLLYAVAGAGALALVGTALPWAGAFEWGLTAGAAGIGLAAVFARVRGEVTIRLGLTVVLLGATLLLSGACAAGHPLLPLDIWPGRAYPTVLSVAVTLAGAGLVRRTIWARWLVIALGIGGAVSAGLNLVGWFSAGLDAATRMDVLPSLWTLVLVLSTSLSMLVLASGARMKAAFAKPFSADEPSTVWSSPSPLVAAVRRGIIAELVALAMCLLYGWTQPVAPSTATSSLALAFGVLGGVILTLARKTLGVVVLVLMGFGLLAQSAFTIAAAEPLGPDAMSTALFYSAFWVPAGLVAVACGVVLSQNVARALRDPHEPTRSRDRSGGGRLER